MGHFPFVRGTLSLTFFKPLLYPFSKEVAEETEPLLRIFLLCQSFFPTIVSSCLIRPEASLKDQQSLHSTALHRMLPLPNAQA